MPEPEPDVCRWCIRDIEWDAEAGAWRHTESGGRFCPDGTLALRDVPKRLKIPTPRSVAVIETGPGGAVTIEPVGNSVHVDWYGPRHVEMGADAARSLGY